MKEFPVFEYERRIGMRDVDAAGIMFFARYLSLVHEAYEEMFLQHGIGFKDQIDKHGIILPVVHVDADYRLSLAVGERTRIKLAVTDIKRRTYMLKFNFTKGKDQLAAEGKIIHACVDYNTRKAVPLPPSLVSVLQACS
jgi:YbgC/YbaW family acyl-CoA thioester hydrolase